LAAGLRLDPLAYCALPVLLAEFRGGKMSGRLGATGRGWKRMGGKEKEKEMNV